MVLKDTNGKIMIKIMVKCKQRIWKLKQNKWCTPLLLCPLYLMKWDLLNWYYNELRRQNFSVEVEYVSVCMYLKIFTMKVVQCMYLF